MRRWVSTGPLSHTAHRERGERPKPGASGRGRPCARKGSSTGWLTVQVDEDAFVLVLDEEWATDG